MGLLGSRIGRPRLCRACGNLIGADNDDCSFCGVKDRFTSGLLREPGRIFGKFGPTRVMAGLIAAWFALAVVVDRVFWPGEESIQSQFALPIFHAFYGIRTFVRLGGLVSWLVHEGQFWRLVTPMFLHIGPVHLLMNGYALFQLGPFLEELYGRSKLISIFVLSAIGSFVAMLLFGYSGAGASGGLFGLIGALIAFGIRTRTRFGEAVRGQAIHWAIYGLIMSLALQGSNTAHIGGLVAGFLVALALGPEEPHRERDRLIQGVIAWVCIGITVLSLLLMALDLPPSGIDWGPAEDR